MCFLNILLLWNVGSQEKSLYIRNELRSNHVVILEEVVNGFDNVLDL